MGIQPRRSFFGLWVVLYWWFLGLLPTLNGAPGSVTLGVATPELKGGSGSLLLATSSLVVKSPEGTATEPPPLPPIFNVPLPLPGSAKGPKKVVVGFYMLSGSKLDFLASQISLDFYIWFIFEGDKEPKFEFMNSKNYLLTKIDMRPITGAPGYSYSSYRVNGMFDQTLDLHNYPFEKFLIQVVFEDVENPIDDQVYLPDTKGTNVDKAFKIIGWNIKIFDLATHTHTYSTNFGFSRGQYTEDRFCQVRLQLEIFRDNDVIFVKVVMPAILIICIAILGVFLPIDQIGQKISLSVASLFSSVAYHLNLSQGLPLLSYLTYSDKMMLGNYSIIFLNLLFVVTLYHANISGRKSLERQLELACMILFPIFLVLFTFALVWYGPLSV